MDVRLADGPVLDLDTDVLIVPELEGDEASQLVLSVGERKERAIEQVTLGTVHGSAPAEWIALVQEGVALGEAVNLARSLAVEPGGHLTPTGLAERARKVASDDGLEVDVLGEERLREL